MIDTDIKNTKETLAADQGTLKRIIDQLSKMQQNLDEAWTMLDNAADTLKGVRAERDQFERELVAVIDKRDELLGRLAAWPLGR